MTWHFDASGSTLQSVEYADGQGNTYSVASNVDMIEEQTWSVAPDKARDKAIDWVVDQASNGNTQTALTALAELQDDRWQQGTA